MRTRHSFVAAFVLLAAAAHGYGARAEVSAETDYAGRYVRTTVLTSVSAKKVKIWSVQRWHLFSHPLNPGGDQSGDLLPVIAENPQDAGQPWVVWSRGTGTGYDLAWSRWTSGGWTSPDWLEAPEEASGGDDLDPSLAFSSQGRPYLVWWRNEGGRGHVYLSVFLADRWMPAYPVSDDQVDSRYPGVALLDDSHVRVDYGTPSGRVSRVLLLVFPTSITDDIDPMARLNGGPPVPPGSSNH
jgi:hypothetical protein